MTPTPPPAPRTPTALHDPAPAPAAAAAPADQHASGQAGPEAAPAPLASPGSLDAGSLDTGSPDAPARPDSPTPHDSPASPAASSTSSASSASPASAASSVSAASSASSVSAASSASASHVSRRFLAKAALVTAALSVAGALLGLVRDQALARLFGAGSETDAFLVAWTVPEFASTLLIEDGLAFALIPAFSLALARRAQGAPGDPVRALVVATLPRLSLALVAVSALLVGTAPYLVGALAPGLPDPALAVDCTRLTATCVLSFGLAGYCSAALRAHRRFLAPATIYVAYNTGIIAGMLVLGGRWGVRSAAAGVAAGGCLMVAAQLPAMWRQLRGRAPAGGAGADEPRPMDLALVGSVLLFALCRQSQTLVERFFASRLPAGAISHLNYAQKVAQMPMVLSLMLCTVTFPVVARALAEGDTGRARDRVERDIALAACLVLLGTATVLACAPQIVELLFQRGAFTARDTAATAGVMRVYALGLLGQTLVGVLVRSYFSAGRPTWYPAGAMGVGILLTSGLGAATVEVWGVCGIAVANAAGITLTAALLLAGPADGPRGVPIRGRQVLAGLGRPVCAALAAATAGALTAHGIGSPVPALVTGAAVVAAVFVLLGRALDVQGIEPALRLVRSATRRLTDGRTR